MKEDVQMKNVTIKMLLCVFCLALLAAPAMAGEINLSAAASLRDVMNELSDTFAKDNPGVTFLKNFGGSGSVAKQIENGAPADLFLSANLKWMDHLKEKKAVDEKSISTLAYNVIVFVGKPELKIKSLQDLAKLNKIAIGSPKSVPAGQYAAEALKKAGIDKELEKKLVMAKDVRECLMYADRGEVDGAFVYKTDAEQLAKNVKILFTVPQELYSRVTYPMALTIAGSKNTEAVAFFRFLQSDEAKGVLARYGFVVR
jgi:molybdate transport system substrate-binding protein